jgi:cobyrinic acid a,c-diamide synthase
VIAAPSTGQGKTTIATGLMAALLAAGHEVSGHKAGPDYIDPGYHALATGLPGRNLDPHLVGEQRIAPLLLHGAGDCGAAVIEGVMGLFDGRLGTGGFASTAHVAKLTATPVVLVLDVARQSRTVAAVAAGLAAFDPDVRVAGVILNRAGSPRNTAEIARALDQVGLPVLGIMPRDDELAAPSRHLGLVPAVERGESAAMIARLGEQVARHLDLAALLDVARQAPDLDAQPWDPTLEIEAFRRVTSSPVVAMAGGRAFTFRYAETEELLRAAGCDVVTFDPLTDAALPAGTRGIYLGGGFPEVYAAELAANRALLTDLRAAVADGIPTVAECAGLLYLARTLDGVPMADAVPAAAAMTSRLTLRYPEATAASDNLLTRTGERVTGHEFHRTQTTPQAGTRPAWQVDGTPTGFTSNTLHASYLHVHWAGHPHLGARFAEAVHAQATPVPSPCTPVPRTIAPPVPEPTRSAASGPAESAVADPLRHHGDSETGSGLLDFAVNVYVGARPAWLDRALHAAINESGSYPNVEPANEAVAAFHGRDRAEALATSGAAEAFTLVARLRPWRRPVVVHPQFTEPHAALEQAGHAVTVAACRSADGFALDPASVPEDADLVVIGNPTNPTGVLHPAACITRLLRPGRLVVVDEAFMDAIPGEPESLAGTSLDGLLVIRSLTKHWSIPGIRAGYVVGDPAIIAALARAQTPWSVSSPAIAATVACTTKEAAVEARERALTLGRWREYLESGLRARVVEHVPSAAPFVLARLGDGTRAALRFHGIAVRRADTFPGLDGTWARMAVRPPAPSDRLLRALDRILVSTVDGF